MQLQAKPPYTSLTAYDLNKGTIRWQIGLGDDYRVVKEAGVRGTGAAQPMKTSVIVTATGLLFANAADRKIHIYDADNGKELHQIPMGAVTSGSPSMFELNGRQYLLVTASPWALARVVTIARRTRIRPVRADWSLSRLKNSFAKNPARIAPTRPLN